MIAVDASVVIKWLFAEEHSDRAEALRGAAERANQAIVAPWLLPFEVTNVIYRRMLREGRSLVEADQSLADILAFRLDLITLPDLHQRAFALANTYSLAATYDAQYVALAQALACDLWTADQRLLNARGSRMPFVRWIGASASKRACELSLRGRDTRGE